MIEVPEHFNPVDARNIREAQRLAKAAGSETFYAVEQLVARFIADRENINNLLNDYHKERKLLCDIIAGLGGGFDRRGLDGDPKEPRPVPQVLKQGSLVDEGSHA